MAVNQKPSKAEKAVTDVKKKATAADSKKSVSSVKQSGKKNDAGKKAAQVKTEYDNRLPGNLLLALASLAMFILCLVIAINPDGALLKFLEKAILGFIGKVGFYFAIPALLYLFVIQAFRTKTNVTMRSWCLVLFVLFCGCISHLTYPEQSYGNVITAVHLLFKGGAEGTTSGVICGSIAMLLRWACGDVLSYIILGLAVALTLLGAMQITIPSLIRAIQNRPRDDWEDEEPEEVYEPAALVVNHIANKQIQHNRQRRERERAAQEPNFLDETYPLPEPSKKKSMKKTESNNVMQFLEENPIGVPSESPAKPVSPKAKDMLSQIDCEISSPVAAAAEPVKEEVFLPDPPQKPKKAKAVPVNMDSEYAFIPKSMPELDISKPITDAPKAVQAEFQKETVTAKDAARSAVEVAAEIEENKLQQRTEYCFPPINLLNVPPKASASGTEEMRENSRRLNETLASFKIDAHIINVTRGPSVTRYEVELDKGVRLSKLTTSADDIALSLGASGVRIAAVPGKISIVGIEVPNRAVTTVSLREVIDSPEFSKSKSKSSFAMGKDIGGSCIIGNIAKMPHLLIAGTTGSGKSVCMNSIIISLLYKAGPEDVKLIMVDPKMVELANYNGIPHLMIPVVTDPKKAAGSLQWAVTEMMRRYKIMSDAGVRDLESFNSIVLAEGGEKIPQLIVIIDELADLMLVAAKEVEDSICRIAQMGRAAGIHLVIATQRPSADVITGLMKANIPSRIAFSVASAMESRIILDTHGAEKLVGRGDMLFSLNGGGKPLRVQGCFVSDGEVEAVTSYVKTNYDANYNQQVLDEIEKKAQQTGKKAVSVSDPEPSDEEMDGDEMLPAAVDVILETGQASVSMLQRRLKLGYARAARIVDEMEEKGIVGPFQGSKPRSILITKEQWEAKKPGAGEQMAFDDLEENFTGVPEEID